MYIDGNKAYWDEQTSTEYKEEHIKDIDDRRGSDIHSLETAVCRMDDSVDKTMPNQNIMTYESFYDMQKRWKNTKNSKKKQQKPTTKLLL